MSLLEALVLGIVQGFAEFLPISSSGHLALLQHIFRIQEPTMTFNVLLHVATLIPIFAVYWSEIVKLLKQPFQQLTYLLVVGTIPAVLAALLLGDRIDMMFASVRFLALGFTLTGLLLLYADRVSAGPKKVRNITYVDALVVGVMQAVAISPAISRSGSTISASLLRKLDRETAAKFSFLLSIPAIAGAVCLEIVKIIKAPPGETFAINPLIMAAGFIAAMLSGYVAINFMLTLIKKAKLRYFAFYVFALAAFIVFDALALGGKLLG